MGYGHHGIWTPHDTGAIGHRPMGHGHHMDPWDTDTVGRGARGRRHHGTRTAHGHVGYGQHTDTTGHGAIAHGWTPMGPTQHMMTHGDMDTNGTPWDTMGHGPRGHGWTPWNVYSWSTMAHVDTTGQGTPIGHLGIWGINGTRTEGTRVGTRRDAHRWCTMAHMGTVGHKWDTD